MELDGEIIYVTAESYIDHSYTIAHSLQKHIKLSVFMQAKERTKEIDSWCNTIGAEFIKRKRFRNPFSFFSGLSFLLKLRSKKPFLVWFNTLTVYQVILAKMLIRKFIVTVHDVEKHPEGTQHHASLALKLTFALLKKNICVVSKTQAEIFKDRFGFDAKMFQLPLIDYFTEAGKKSAAPEKSNMVRFFFFGSVEEYKGIETLFEAAKILEQKGLSFSLGIYGKLKYDAEKIKKCTAELKNVILVDKFINFDEVHSIYAANDVIVLPYKQVTQCGPLLIGYNELTPAICSSLPGFYEYVDDEKSGLIFDGSAESLAGKMEELIKNPSIIYEMKKYIDTKIRGKFSMSVLAEQYLKNFKEIIG